MTEERTDELEAVKRDRARLIAELHGAHRERDSLLAELAAMTRYADAQVRGSMRAADELRSLRGVVQAAREIEDELFVALLAAGQSAWPDRMPDLVSYARTLSIKLHGALAAAADAPQTDEDEEERGEPGPCCDCEQGCVMEGGPCLHPPTCDHGKTEAHSYTFASVPRELRWCPGPSPAVLPETPETKDQR